MTRKHFIILSLSLLVTVSVSYCLPVGLLVTIDPLYVLYDHDGDMEHFIEEERYWVPGAIRQYLFHNRSKRNVAIGSSMMLNANSRDMERFAGLAKGMVLAVLGMSPYEFSVIFNKVCQAEQVENIVLTFDTFRYFKDTPSSYPYFPAGLYGDFFIAKLEEMLRMDVVRMAFRMLCGRERARDLDSRSALMQRASRKHAYSRYAQNYEQAAAEHGKRAATLTFSEDDTAFDSSPLDPVIALFRNAPDHIRLHLLIAPSFRGADDVLLTYADYYHGLLYLLQALRDKENIIIYGFDDIPAITNNIANFQDVMHYGIGVTRYMFKAVGARKHVITEDNVRDYLTRVWESRKYGKIYYDPEHTVSFEGPLDEELFQKYPPPDGPNPLPLPE